MGFCCRDRACFSEQARDLLHLMTTRISDLRGQEEARGRRESGHGSVPGLIADGSHGVAQTGAAVDDGDRAAREVSGLRWSWTYAERMST